MRKEVRLNFGITKVFGAILSLALVSGFADEGKVTPVRDDVSKSAISADADAHCNKAKASSETKSGDASHCDKSQMKATGKHDESHCPKSADCPKAGQCLKHKTGKTKATHSHDDAAKDAVPAVKPADVAKTESHPG